MMQRLPANWGDPDLGASSPEVTLETILADLRASIARLEARGMERGRARVQVQDLVTGAWRNLEPEDAARPVPRGMTREHVRVVVEDEEPPRELRAAGAVNRAARRAAASRRGRT
jgi:hypothetical protein